LFVCAKVCNSHIQDITPSGLICPKIKAFFIRILRLNSLRYKDLSFVQQAAAQIPPNNKTLSKKRKNRFRSAFGR